MSISNTRGTWLSLTVAIAALLSGGAMIVASLWLFTPWLAAVRTSAFWGGLSAGSVLLAVLWLLSRRDASSGLGRWLRVAAAASIGIGLALVITADARFRSRKAQAFWAPQSELATVGRHIILKPAVDHRCLAFSRRQLNLSV